MTVLNETTLIPMGLAISLIGGGAWFMARLHFRMKELGDWFENHEKQDNTRHERITEKINSVNQQQLTLVERVTRIETKIDILLDNFKK